MGYLQQSELQNGANVDAKILPILAGNTRLLHEYVTGTVKSGVVGCAPVVPHRNTSWVPNVGHDHSGGIMGRPFRFTLWSCIFGQPYNVLSTTGDTAPYATVTATNSTLPLIDDTIRACWIPGCPPDGVYGNAQIRVVTYADVAAKIRVRFEQGPYVADKTSSIGTGRQVTVLDERAWLRPGEVQNARLLIEGVRDAADSVVQLLSVHLAQTRYA